MYREKNPLLVKNDIGKSKPFTHDLPSDDHVYGKELKRETYGAGALTSDWQLSKPNYRTETHRDFQKLNKVSLRCGVTSPKDVKQFRMNTDIRIKKKFGKPTNLSALNTIASAQDLSPAKKPYGRPNRPQTPLKGIINGTYGNEAEQEYKQRFIEVNHLRHCGTKKTLAKPKETKAHLMAAQ